MEKILNTTLDCYGNQTPVAILSQRGGLFRLWEVNCMSSLAHNLGNCLCVNHPASIETPVSTAEVIQQFGEEALDGFDTQNDEQLVFDAFGIEINELETYLKVSYHFNINPLPGLRERTDAEIVFGEDPDLLVFPDLLPGTVVFIVNSRGEIAVKKV